MNSFSYHVSRHELTQIIDAMPAETYRVMHLAVTNADLPTAQRLLREAAATYFTSAPAAPAAMPPAPRWPTRHPGTSPARLSHKPCTGVDTNGSRR
jgi:hypothetical protein